MAVIHKHYILTSKVTWVFIEFCSLLRNLFSCILCFIFHATIPDNEEPLLCTQIFFLAALNKQASSPNIRNNNFLGNLIFSHVGMASSWKRFLDGSYMLIPYCFFHPMTLVSFSIDVEVIHCIFPSIFSYILQQRWVFFFLSYSYSSFY